MKNTIFMRHLQNPCKSREAGFRVSGFRRKSQPEPRTLNPQLAQTGGFASPSHVGYSWFFYGHADLLSNQAQGILTLSDPLNILALGWEVGWNDTDGTAWEGNLTYGRYFNRFTTLFAGVYAEGVNSTREDERLIVGIRYLLPGNIHSQSWIDDKGEARFMLERELMLTPRLEIFIELEYDTREKWSTQAGMSYALTQYVSATALWDSNYGGGVGLTVRF